MPEAAGRAAATQRLFFALWPDIELAAGLDAVATAAARRFGGRPTRRETLHLTLAFLGDIAISEVPALIDAGRHVVASPFELNIDRLGFWRHNRLLWAGCAPIAGLDRLIAQLQAALAAAGYPLAIRQHSFTPHLTLVRKLPASTPPGEVGGFPLGQLAAWPCSHFRLVESRLTASGSEYTPIAEFPLAA
ncbi:MAG: RNA 2',3'-cyclic phosphodiesterase [Betaproteobacteria bacterium HGW-Betaproteobacteria-12]|nr:MAG: RNA 2',3'-cyclic phosphodiesterase [Betaproteobacteria bacterium HGW-Betaproteobacteria-12]